MLVERLQRQHDAAVQPRSEIGQLERQRSGWRGAGDHQPSALLVQLLVQAKQRALPARIACNCFRVIETHERELAVAGERSRRRAARPRAAAGTRRSDLSRSGARAHRLQQMRLADRRPRHAPRRKWDRRSRRSAARSAPRAHRRPSGCVQGSSLRRPTCRAAGFRAAAVSRPSSDRAPCDCRRTAAAATAAHLDCPARIRDHVVETADDSRDEHERAENGDGDLRRDVAGARCDDQQQKDDLAQRVQLADRCRPAVQLAITEERICR